jgi:transposase
VAFLGTVNRKVLLKRLSFENNQDGFNKLLTRAKAFQGQEKMSNDIYGIGPTANYHKPLADFLVEQKKTVFLVSGTAVKRNHELLEQGDALQ